MAQSCTFSRHRIYWYFTWSSPKTNSPSKYSTRAFLGGSNGKEPACSAGDPGSIPISGRSLGEGNGNPLLVSQLVKNLPTMQETPVQFPGLGSSTGEGIGYPLQDSWASLVAKIVKNAPAMWRPGFNPWVGKIHWKRERLSNPVFWSGEFHGLCSPWGRKESDVIEWLSLIHSLTSISCLENSIDIEDWLAIVHGVAKSWTQLSN